MEDSHQASALSSPLLAGWLCSRPITNSHGCTPTPRRGFLPFNVNCDGGQELGRSLQPLPARLAVLSPACWHSSPSSVLAGWPPLQGNKGKGWNGSTAGPAHPRQRSSCRRGRLSQCPQEHFCSSFKAHRQWGWQHEALSQTALVHCSSHPHLCLARGLVWSLPLLSHLHGRRLRGRLLSHFHRGRLCGQLVA